MPVVIGDVALIGDAWPGGFPGDPVVELPCGFGPTVQVGGQTLETSVSTTRSRLLTRQDATLTACGGPVVVSPGRVRIQALSSGEFSVRSLVLDARYVTDPEGGPAPDPVTTTTWGATSRAVDLGSASERDTVLVVRENANDGWVATAGGATLRPVMVDGWAQGWVVPAGTEGLVELRFAPQRVFLVSLALGAALAVLLVLLVLRGQSPLTRAVSPEVSAPRAGRSARRGRSGRDRWSCRGGRSRLGTPGAATREVAPVGRGGGGRVRRPDVGRLGTGAAVALSGRLQPRRLVRRARAVPRGGGHDVWAQTRAGQRVEVRRRAMVWIGDSSRCQLRADTMIEATRVSPTVIQNPYSKTSSPRAARTANMIGRCQRKSP